MQFTKTFRKYLGFNTATNQSDGIEVVTLLESSALIPVFPADYYAATSIFIESLNARVYLPSFPIAPYPDISIEMSSAEKYEALIANEDLSPHLGIQFYLKKGSGNWLMTGVCVRPSNKGRETLVPILQPYLTQNLVKLLDPDEILGVQLIDYGHGRLQNGDFIILEGELRIEVNLVNIGGSIITEPPTNFSFSATPTASIFRTANQKRAWIHIQNNGSNNAWIGFNSAAINSGLRIEPGATLWLDKNTLSGSAIWAIAEGGTTTLSGIEAFYV